MDFLFNAVSNVVQSVASGAATYCIVIFYEPEVPESLRAE